MPRVILKPPAENPHAPQRIPIGVTLSQSTGGGEKPDTAPKPMNRAASMKYKEKFNAMRHKYEQVMTKHEEYQRQLDTANAKIKKMQVENDLLLDVISAGQWPPTPPNDSIKPPHQGQQYSNPSQPPPPTLHQPSPYSAPSYTYNRSHEGGQTNYPTPPALIPGAPNPNYPPHPAQPAASGPNHHHSHNRRSPHLIHANGERGSGSNISVNEYPTHTRSMETHERELPPPRPTQPHRHSEQGQPPQSTSPLLPPSASSHEINGRPQ